MKLSFVQSDSIVQTVVVSVCRYWLWLGS